ncbi:MAG: hypothetical protein JWQ64_3157, partial [Subtercola sp.]|nr:hypothetical protein [Subtercola sp.]
RGARNDGRITGRAGRLTRELMNSWELTLSTFNHVRVEVGEVAGDYLALMTKHGLSSMDAISDFSLIRRGCQAVGGAVEE